MADATQIVYDFKELAELMVKEQGINQGLWAVYVNFGLKAANLGTNDSHLVPTAMVGLLQIGLQRMDTPSNLTVDAAKVNPKTPNKTPKTKKG